MTFSEALAEQRWDDHRFYHHSRINQTLHLVSACSFVVTYFLLFTQPVFAVLFGWTFSMVSRQIGHFFFEPKGYDDMNQATHEYKERVKVGFNLRRKVILHTLWALIPLALWLSPSLFGIFAPWTDLGGYLDHLAKAWLVLAGVGLVGRTVQLFFIRDVQTGLVWFTKILTDPFNDIKQYWRAPLALMRGELIQPAHGRPA
ncbi:MAG TPA: hypothetical protein VHK47_00255 [Polyangia bacterium]|jgi:hypothetical protein|nr:hypothetical protein [Polyangia bacterium]